MDNNPDNTPQPPTTNESPEPLTPTTSAPAEPTPTSTPAEPAGQPTVPGSTNESAAHKSKGTMKKIVIAVVALLLLAAAAAAALMFFKPVSADKLYRQAIEESISGDANKKIYGSMNLESNGYKVNGELQGDLQGKNGTVVAGMVVDTSFSGVPVKIYASIISLQTEKQDTNYLKYNSVTSNDSDYKDQVEDYFAPAVDKWVKSVDENPEEDEPADFATDGPFAAVDAFGIYAPLTPLSEKDQQTFLGLIDKYNLYQVEDKVESTTFRGVDARKVHVSVKKETLKEFENEAATALSKDADFQKFSDEYVEDLFGGKDTISADVYLAKNKAQIVGVNQTIDFKDPITAESFGNEMKYVKASILLDYDRKLNPEIPKNTITDEQLSELIGS